MLNTILSRFTAKRNYRLPALQVKPVKRPIFDKYFKYYVEDGYSEQEANLIADIFQASADNADVFECSCIQELAKTNSLSMCCNGSGVGLYACPFGTRDNQLVCRISLETALSLANNDLVQWERFSRHFLEYYFLA